MPPYGLHHRRLPVVHFFIEEHSIPEVLVEAACALSIGMAISSVLSPAPGYWLIPAPIGTHILARLVQRPGKCSETQSFARGLLSTHPHSRAPWFTHFARSSETCPARVVDRLPLHNCLAIVRLVASAANEDRVVLISTSIGMFSSRTYPSIVKWVLGRPCWPPGSDSFPSSHLIVCTVPSINSTLVPRAPCPVASAGTLARLEQRHIV